LKGLIKTVNNTELIGASSSVIAEEAVKILIEKKGIDVRLYDVREKTSVTDFYINVTGRSNTHVSSLADDVVTLLEERGVIAQRVEGRRGNEWLLVDYTDVIINVFDRKSREFYNLDRHFAEGSLVDITELIAEVDKKFETK